MKPVFQAIVTALLAFSSAAAARPAAIDSSERYRQCLDKIADHPGEAYEVAALWVDQEGGLSARHCFALALAAVGQFRASAEKLKALAQLKADIPAATRAELWTQAGEAWLLEKAPDQALRAFEEGARLSPDDGGIWIDKARASAMKLDWKAAAQTLDRALSLDPTLVEAWLLRATARRELGQLALAEDDVETALALDDARGDIWLERGRLEQIKGNRPAARRAFLRAITADEKNPVAEQARYALEAMDLKP